VNSTIDRRLMIFFVLLIGVMAPVPVDEYAPSLPAMVAFFGSSVSAMQLSITAFLLALGIGQVVLGPLSGRRIVLIAGMAVYLVGTLVCIVADGVWLLMVGRVVQGLGIASCAMTSDASPPTSA
jgi:MFS family permease